MYGSPTTKEIKKKHSSRPVGGVEMGSQAESTRGGAVAGGPREVPDCGAGEQSCSWPVRQQLVDQVTDCTIQGSSSGK